MFVHAPALFFYFQSILFKDQTRGWWLIFLSPRALSSPRERKEGGEARKRGGVRLPNRTGITSTSPPHAPYPPPLHPSEGCTHVSEECTQRKAPLSGANSFSFPPESVGWLALILSVFNFLCTYFLHVKTEAIIFKSRPQYVRMYLLSVDQQVEDVICSEELLSVQRWLHDEDDTTRTQADKTSLWIPDKCPLLIGRGWARVPPQTQCTTTSAAEGWEENEKQERNWKIEKLREKCCNSWKGHSSDSSVKKFSLTSSWTLDPGDTWRRI